MRVVVERKRRKRRRMKRACKRREIRCVRVRIVVLRVASCLAAF